MQTCCSAQRFSASGKGASSDMENHRRSSTLNEQFHPHPSTSAPDTEPLPAIFDMLLESRFPLDVEISADGKHAAFVVAEYVPGEQKRRQCIWKADTTSGEARPFVSGKHDASCPRWSPDSKQLAFITQPEGTKRSPSCISSPLKEASPGCSAQCPMA